ncbi:MAG TPA: hypothetical protein VNN74_05990 [Candidatus Micrarchaeia archaeon]|nr:hypothetical protein [Candidatus Micrarchaeia archaeon]
METGVVTTVVVVGDRQLARAVARLIPAATILDAEQEPDLREPATAVPVIRRRMEDGATPAAVVCDARPGFSVLAGVTGFPAHRCLVVGAESPFPAGTVRSLVEAAGMTFLAALDGLPAFLAGRGPGLSGADRGRVRATPPGREPAGAGTGVDGWAAAGSDPAPGAAPGPPPESFSWAAMTPVQVPPAAPAGAAPAAPATVVEAGVAPRAGEGAPAAGARAHGLPAYGPADPLRPMRPRKR